MKRSVFLMIAGGLAVAVPFSSVGAAETGRFDIVNIKRDVEDGKENRTVNGTMMLDRDTGRTWILDEQKGQWLPVGFKNADPSTGVTLPPGSSK